MPMSQATGLVQIRCVLVLVDVGVQGLSKYRVRVNRLALHRHSCNSPNSSSTGSELVKTLCSLYSNRVNETKIKSIMRLHMNYKLKLRVSSVRIDNLCRHKRIITSSILAATSLPICPLTRARCSGMVATDWIR